MLEPAKASVMEIGAGVLNRCICANAALLNSIFVETAKVGDLWQPSATYVHQK